MTTAMLALAVVALVAVSTAVPIQPPKEPLVAVDTEPTSHDANPILCNVCVEAVAEAGKYLQQGEPVVKEKVEALCAKLGKFASLCDEYIIPKLDQVISSLQSGSTDKEVCTELDACAANYAPSMPAVSMVVEASADSLAVAIPVCPLCKQLVNVLEVLLDEGAKELEVEAEKKLCPDFGALAGVCGDLVREYVPKLVAYIDAHEAGPEACVHIGVCPKNDVSTSVDSQLECVECEVTLNEVEEEVGKNEAPAETDAHTFGIKCEICVELLKGLGDISGDNLPAITAKADAECDKLGGLATVCKNLVAEYLPELVKAVKNSTDEKEACTKVHLC